MSRPRLEEFFILKHSPLRPGLWPWTSAHAPSSCAHSHVNRPSFRLRIPVPQRYCLFRDGPAVHLVDWPRVPSVLTPGSLPDPRSLNWEAPPRAHLRRTPLSAGARGGRFGVEWPLPPSPAGPREVRARASSPPLRPRARGRSSTRPGCGARRWGPPSLLPVCPHLTASVLFPRARGRR